MWAVRGVIGEGTSILILSRILNVLSKVACAQMTTCRGACCIRGVAIEDCVLLTALLAFTLKLV